MCAQIILLHGPSSSGKSTLARALQDDLPTMFWHLSIDHMRDSGALPMARFRQGDLHWPSHRDAIFAGFNAMIAACADAGNDLIVEHIFDEPVWVETLKGSLSTHDVFFVGLMCDLETLNAREAVRGDRKPGSAAQDHAQVHLGRRYDIELDGAAPVEDNVAEILMAWRGGRRVSEFHAAQPE